MPTLADHLQFALVAIAMVLTPGPNMIYLVSRAICQGRMAGFISLAGIALGFMIYLLCAALGITAIFMSVPRAYDVLRLAGAIYLLYLAWQAVKPGGRSPLQVRDLPQDGPRRLFGMGLFTSLLNPKIAILYVSLLPQFIQTEHGSVLLQSLVLGLTQITISVSVNAAIVFMAGGVALFFASRPAWQLAQRWLMGTVLAGLAVRMAVESRR
ncbi:MAG: LysE family translocator [Pseudomonadota bacterium]|nr:LysE family translocator [Pseudomonadota bacterium]